MKHLNKRLILAVLVVVTSIASTNAAVFTRPVSTASKVEQSQITLLTGDVVIIDISKSYLITDAWLSDPASAFTFYIKNAQAYLIPNHAQSLIEQGIVDAELFNLSKLVSLQLDDRNNNYLPILVKYSVPHQRLDAGIDSQFYPAINTQFIRLEKAKLAQTWLQISNDPTIKSITLDNQIPHH